MMGNTSYNQRKRVPPQAMLCVIVLFIFGATPARSQPDPWTAYSPSLQDFSVLFQGVPEAKASTSAKGIEVRSYTSPFGACIYGVAVYSYPQNFFPGWNGFPNTFLDHSQKVQLGAMQLALRTGSEHAVAQQDFPGREFTGDGDKYSVRWRISLSGTPPGSLAEYHLKVLCLKEADIEQQSSPFMASFKILASAPQPAPWKQYSSSADHFTALFPSDPQISTPTGANGLPTRQYTATFGTSSYLVGVVVYPYNSVDYTGFPNSMLDATQQGSLTAAHMTLRNGSENVLAQQGKPGREYIGEGPSNTVKTRILLRGKPPQEITVYQMIVVSPKQFEAELLAKQFLDSFQILD
jgi:hypothetical protein